MNKFFLHKKKNKLSAFINFLMSQVVFLSGGIAIISLLLITAYVFYNGVLVFKHITLSEFLIGHDWEPVTQKLFGVFPMILTSFYVTFGAVIISAPIGIACAVFLAELASPLSQKIIRPAVQLLVGIPSVVYGLVGLAFVVPAIQYFANVAGLSILAAIIILSIMIIPTIISISEDAI